MKHSCHFSNSNHGINIMRLDKYVASVSELSRNDAKKAIRGGRVTVEGQKQRDPKYPVEISAAIILNGSALCSPGKRYIMLNKPEGYVSATKDKQHLTVMDLLEEENCAQLHIAGRLDLDTTGLVLITDDGQWSHRVTSPTLPAHIEIIDEHTARLIISEGRYHQVKRMFGAMGNKVDCLHRERIGDIYLDSSLQPGEYRHLTPVEIESI
jgi:16S rRNA pseudouridine516 synthase